MYQDGAPARLAAIVDWEMGTVGDPKLDLGWVVQSWPDDTERRRRRRSRATSTCPACRHATRSSRTTPKVSGRQVDDIDYYVVLAKWKLAIVLEQGFQRAGDDEKLTAFGPIVLDLMQGAAELAETHRLPVVTDEAEVVARAPRRRPRRCGSTVPRRATRSRARMIGEHRCGGRRRRDRPGDPRGRAHRHRRPRVLRGHGPARLRRRATCRRSTDERRAPRPASCGCSTATSRIPVVGAANGTAVAGGFELLLGCDVDRRVGGRASSACPR